MLRETRCVKEFTRSLAKGDVLWDGSNDRGAWVASGVYACRLTAGNYHALRKMVLLR